MDFSAHRHLDKLLQRPGYLHLGQSCCPLRLHPRRHCRFHLFAQPPQSNKLYQVPYLQNILSNPAEVWCDFCCQTRWDSQQQTSSTHQSCHQTNLQNLLVQYLISSDDHHCLCQDLQVSLFQRSCLWVLHLRRCHINWRWCFVDLVDSLIFRRIVDFSCLMIETFCPGLGCSVILGCSSVWRTCWIRVCFSHCSCFSISFGVFFCRGSLWLRLVFSPIPNASWTNNLNHHFHPSPTPHLEIGPSQHLSSSESKHRRSWFSTFPYFVIQLSFYQQLC